MTATELRGDPRRWVAENLDHDPAAVTEARKAAGLTKRELAARLKCTESLIGEIEKGTRNATPARLRRMARVLKCTVADLRSKQDA